MAIHDCADIGRGKFDYERVIDQAPGQSPHILSSEWALFSFTRFLAEQVGLAHMLDILSSKRALHIE